MRGVEQWAESKNGRS